MKVKASGGGRLMLDVGAIAYRLGGSPLTIVGLAIVLCVVLVALAAPLLATHDPLALDIRNRLAPPGAGHWFGTDEIGRDLYSRVVHGARLSLGVGFLVVFMATVAGTLVGCFSGMTGGKTDAVIMRLVDVLLSIPGLVLAMALTAALGPSLMNAMFALTVVMVPAYIRLARGQALLLRSRAYVEVAAMIGAGRWHTLRQHIIPNSIAPVVVQATADVGNVILVAAALSFIGLGAQPPAPEWGALVSSGRQYLQDHWWYATFPGFAIVITATGFNLVGDGLRDLLDPTGGRSG